MKESDVPTQHNMPPTSLSFLLGFKGVSCLDGRVKDQAWRHKPQHDGITSRCHRYKTFIAFTLYVLVNYGDKKQSPMIQINRSLDLLV
jgi:hypothetical protein